MSIELFIITILYLGITVLLFASTFLLLDYSNSYSIKSKFNKYLWIGIILSIAVILFILMTLFYIYISIYISNKNKIQEEKKFIMNYAQREDFDLNQRKELNIQKKELEKLSKEIQKKTFNLTDDQIRKNKKLENQINFYENQAKIYNLLVNKYHKNKEIENERKKFIQDKEFENLRKKFDIQGKEFDTQEKIFKLTENLPYDKAQEITENILIVFQLKHFPLFYKELTDSNSPFFIESLIWKKIIKDGIEFKDKYRTYYLAYPEKLNVKELFLNDVSIFNDFFTFYRKNRKSIEKNQNCSVIIPFRYNESIKSQAGHAVLCIIERINGINFLYVINSHPEQKFSNEIINSVKNITEKEKIKISRFEIVTCGTQLRAPQCVKYTAKLIYNYIHIGKNFSEIKPIICPGYSKEQNLLFPQDYFTKVSDTQVTYNGNRYSHLNSEDVYYMNSLVD